ncbi:MAG TPA: CoA-acylating methylmalonate-semialdehyde dehydrogenase [Tepidisphaeraceae bacterium]|jgi:malonate-semialdehyde dehydrogenase (acetylating)/methylmalonate-semialdehyde dehydrogenase|nr:CoA-acylating methylmalonate-semialdehyde dehydrogenase [Tepidisphaeraceae bacterium]
MTAVSSASSAVKTTPRLPFLDNGRWVTSSSDRFGQVFNPSRGKAIAEVPFCTAQEVDHVIQSAAAALEGWADTPVVERVHVLFKFRQICLDRFDALATCVTREHGKTMPEAKASVQRGIEVIEFACGAPSLIMGDTLANIARNVDNETIRHPVGVCAGITPFNFPFMVPLWMFPIAIACGNTFVLKPSERVPMTSNLLGEMMIEAGLPPGVFNIVHGDKTCVDALLTHPLVKAISFVGSTSVAQYVYETGTRHGKRVQAAGGAKNHLIIMPDADLDQAALAVQTSAFGCAGERCMAGSIAVPVGDVAQDLVKRLTEIGQSMKTGPTDGSDSPDMGPLITRQHQQRVAGYLDIAAGEGARVALDGRQVPAARSDGFFVGPSIVDMVKPDMRLAKEEVFGPVLAVLRVKSIEEAISVARDCPYGNGASIFTNNGWAAREFKMKFNAGMIGINIGVPAPMAWFPFTGWNKSFFGDLHIQGLESIHFYTQQKTIMTRWFKSAGESHHDPVWRSGKS